MRATEVGMSGSVLVVGLGEVGRPLLEVVVERYPAVGIDIEPVEFRGECEVMHICYSFQGDEFVEQTAAYVKEYSPGITIVNSTVAPGTTRAIYDATKAAIVHSPVRGKHYKMKEELRHYSKFVGGITEEWSGRAAEHFQSLGMKTTVLSSPEATELAKLSETTFFGLMIAWAQEVERYCDRLSLDYDEVVSFYEEIGFFPPVKYFPGLIGGHCVMPNIEILKSVFKSDILEAIEGSNWLKELRDAPEQ
jgi:UDP-N-acetyl-D-mannosaminuronate dehydrogenase